MTKEGRGRKYVILLWRHATWLSLAVSGISAKLTQRITEKRDKLGETHLATFSICYEQHITLGHIIISYQITSRPHSYYSALHTCSNASSILIIKHSLDWAFEFNTLHCKGLIQRSAVNSLCFSNKITHEIDLILQQGNSLKYTWNYNHKRLQTNVILCSRSGFQRQRENATCTSSA